MTFESLNVIREVCRFLEQLRTEEVRTADCPKNQTAFQDVLEEATACDEATARRRLHKKLVDKAKSVRHGTGAERPCTGGGCEENHSRVTVAVIEKDKVVCDPADYPRCPEGVGYYCYYAGRLAASCNCAPNIV